MRTLHLIAVTAALASAAPAFGQLAPGSQDEASVIAPDSATRLRCAAAFMIIRDQQRRDIAAVKTYPAMEPRGSRYIDYVIAREIDERNLDLDGAKALVDHQIGYLQGKAFEAPNPRAVFDEVMKPCLRILDAKFPPK